MDVMVIKGCGRTRDGGRARKPAPPPGGRRQTAASSGRGAGGERGDGRRCLGARRAGGWRRTQKAAESEDDVVLVRIVWHPVERVERGQVHVEPFELFEVVILLLRRGAKQGLCRVHSRVPREWEEGAAGHEGGG